MWQIIQTLLGLLVVKITKATPIRKIEDVTIYQAKGYHFGVSLGKCIIFGEYIGEHSIAHEFGHCKQSRILGPFYLLIVGLPSIIQNKFCNPNNYYNRFPENWADKLGGVKRC